MTTVNKENVEINEEEFMTTEEETIDSVMNVLGLGLDIYKKMKKDLVRRGFINGLLTAVAIQSLVTIFIMYTIYN